MVIDWDLYWKAYDEAKECGATDDEAASYAHDQSLVPDDWYSFEYGDQI
jgi:hypothetical protein